MPSYNYAHNLGTAGLIDAPGTQLSAYMQRHSRYIRGYLDYNIGEWAQGRTWEAGTVHASRLRHHAAAGTSRVADSIAGATAAFHLSLVHVRLDTSDIFRMPQLYCMCVRSAT